MIKFHREEEAQEGSKSMRRPLGESRAGKECNLQTFKKEVAAESEGSTIDGKVSQSWSNQHGKTR